MTVVAPAGSALAGATGPPARGHLQQVDLFRVVTFAAVVGVHSLGATASPDSVAAGEVGVVLHYTREAFFLLTGFVLAHSQRDRPLQLGRFWSRRMTLVGVPYLVWSLLYTVLDWQLAGRPGPGAAWHLLWTGLLTGESWYHLYFLLVTLQIYALWPLLVRLRRFGTERPLPLLAAAAAATVVATGYAHVFKPDPGAAQTWRTYGYTTVAPYLFWVIGGAVAAWHLDRVQRWAVRRRAVLSVAALASLGLTLIAYRWQLQIGWTPPTAADPVQPVFLLWGSGAIALQALLALAWVRVRRPGSRATRFVLWGSSASFGVYLLHPLVLQALVGLGLTGVRVGEPWRTLLVWAITLVVSALLVLAIRATPLSMPLTGRRRPAASRPPVAPVARAQPEPVHADPVQAHPVQAGSAAGGER